MLVIGHFRCKALERRTAKQRQRRSCVGGHITRVTPKRDVSGQFVFYAAANAVRKIQSCRVAPAVEFVREAQSPRNVWPPLVLFPKNLKERSKLILVYARVVGLHIRRTGSLLGAVGSQVTVPHKLKFRIRRERIADEGAKTRRPVNTQGVYRYCA